MFPCKEERIKWDEYGEIIRPEDYVIPETNVTEEENRIKIVSPRSRRKTLYSF